MSFKLHTALSSVMKFCTIPLCPAWAMMHTFVQSLHTPDTPRR